MALTYSEQTKFVAGDRRVWVGDITFDDSYPTGGETVSPDDVPSFQHSVDTVVAAGRSSDGVESVTVDHSPTDGTVKVLVFPEDGTDGIHDEASDTSDQSGVKVPVIIIGR